MPRNLGYFLYGNACVMIYIYYAVTDVMHDVRYNCIYEGCSNMNASSFITFLTYMLRRNGKRFYKGLYVIFKLPPDLKKNTVYLSSYSPSYKGHVSILTNSML